jgi:hypothetical protein
MLEFSVFGKIMYTIRKLSNTNKNTDANNIISKLQ